MLALQRLHDFGIASLDAKQLNASIRLAGNASIRPPGNASIRPPGSASILLARIIRIIWFKCRIA
jgi:hypothetical protein